LVVVVGQPRWAEAEKHVDGSCLITPTIRVGEGAGALPPPGPEGRHSN
jgi:hypothetical protein